MPTCISTNQNILELSTSFWLSQMRTSIEQSSVWEKKAKKVLLQQIKIALKSIKGKTRLLHSRGKQHLLLKILPINTLIQAFETVEVTFEISICASSISVGKEGCSIYVANIQYLVQYLVLAVEPSCCCSWMSSASCFCRDISLPCTCLINGCSKRWVTEGRFSKSLIRHLWQRNRGLRQWFYFITAWTESAYCVAVTLFSFSTHLSSSLCNKTLPHCNKSGIKYLAKWMHFTSIQV